MKKLVLFCLTVFLLSCTLGCAAEEYAPLQELETAKAALSAQIDGLQQQVDALVQENETLKQELAALYAEQEAPPSDDYTQYFNYILIDGKYCAMSVKQDAKVPEVLVVPNRYQDVEVAYTGNELIQGLPVKTIVFEPGVECSAYLCGYGHNCPTLENIVLLSEDPNDSIYRKIHGEYLMPLQLNNPQLAGACKIYVPDGSVDAYIDAWMGFSNVYAPLIHPLSELSEELLPYIS